MSKKLTCVFLFASLAGGCSFLQDWNEFRDTDDEDAGTTDAGTGDAAAPDASVDAGAGGCNECLDEGCDPASSDCQFDSTDMCFYCDGSVEGTMCFDDTECTGDLVCEYGVCLHECGSRADCVTRLAFGEECVPAPGGRSVCVNHECDPVLGDCDAAQVCTYAIPEDRDDDLASICSYPTATIVPAGDVCQPPAIDCGNGFVCIDVDGDGEPRCNPWCYLDAMSCDAGETCVGLGSGSGGFLAFQGREIGVCAVLMCDTITCPAGERCEPDGAGDVTCVPTCAVDADCPTSMGRCEAGVCYVDCTDDAECSALGYARCIGGGPSGMTCVNDCPSGGSTCSDGSACIDPDADGVTECLP